MLNGKWLGAQNWVARNQGGVSEIGAYGWFHPMRHVIQIDGWRTATGENWFSKGTNLANADFVRYYARYYPQYLLHRLSPDPSPSNNNYLLFIQQLPSSISTAKSYQLKINPAYYLSQTINKQTFRSDQTIDIPTIFLAGDLNNDNIINSIDFSIMNQDWFKPSAVADINEDGIVNTVDFSFLNKNWGMNGG